MAKRKKSRKALEQYRRRLKGDVNHALRCCQAGFLSPAHCAYLNGILHNERLPLAAVIAQQIGLTNEQRERHRLWSLPPTDKTKAEMAALRKEKERKRKALARRKAHVQCRDAYYAQFANSERKRKPWEEASVSRRTWFRQKARGAIGTRCVRTTEARGTGCIRDVVTYTSDGPGVTVPAEPPKKSRSLADGGVPK